MDPILGDSVEQESFDKKKPEPYQEAIILVYLGSYLNEICQLNLFNMQEQYVIWYPIYSYSIGFEISALC